MRESRDELSKRNVELARQVRELNEENQIICKENRDLRLENGDMTELLKEIKRISEQNTYNNDKVALRKIKELVSDYQSQN